MTKSPPNGNDTNTWKLVTWNKQNKDKRNMMSKLAPVKGSKGKKYEGINGVTVKIEEMTSALAGKCPSPKRKRDTSEEVIVLDDDSDKKMDIDGARLGNEVVIDESSS